MLLRPRVGFVASLLLVLAAGCSSGVRDEAKKDAKSDTKQTGDSNSSTPSKVASADSDEPKRPPRRGDGTAEIAAKRDAELDKAEAEVRRKTTLGGKPPAKDDLLMLEYLNDPNTINAILGNDTTSEEFQRWVYEPLADREMADPDTWKPALAEKWEFDEKNLEFKIHLRHNVKWHPIKLPNGEALPTKEFTAKDVKFTFDCILNKGVAAASIRSYFEDPDAPNEADRIKIKVTVIDDYNLKIKWTKPYFQIKEFTLGIGIIPRHVYSVDETGKPISFDFGSQEFADGFNKHWANSVMCGTGPMIFREWKRGTRLELVRNPDYWGEPFYFNRVIFKNIPNTQTALEQMLQNDIDYNTISDKDKYIQTKTNPNVVAGKVTLKEFPYPSFSYLGYNLRREFLKEKLVRKALSHAIPVETIIAQVHKGLARRTSGPFLLGSSAYDTTVPLVPYDLDKARALLAEAGWKDSNNDGILDKTISGKLVPAKFDLLVLAVLPQSLRIAAIIKENFRKVGVEMQITPIQWDLMLQRLHEKNLDATLGGWALGWKQDPFQIWHSSQADVPDSSNAVGYQNKELDKLIEELRVTLDEKKQVELYHKMHKILADDQPYTFLYSAIMTAGYDSRLENVKFYKLRPCIDQREWTSSRPRLVGN